MSVRKSAAAVLLAMGAMSQAPAAQAASVAYSTWCPSGVCASFGSTATIPIIKSLTFTMPAAGTVLVTYHGSLYCGASGVAATDRVIDFYTGITTAAATNPVLTTVGTMRVAHVLKDHSPDHALDPSTTFNLHSTRVVDFPAGTHRVYFKINRARQDAGVNCIVYGSQLFVTRLP